MTHDLAAELMTNARRIAVVGCSTTPGKDAHEVPKEMRDRWEILPVNPRADTIFGVKAYPDLAAIEGPIDIVNVFRPAAEAADVARAAAAVGAKALWLQLGIRSQEARQIATDAGMAYIEDDCLRLARRRAHL